LFKIGHLTAHVRKILVANRGEIAVRIIRACKELNIRTVAVYSEATPTRCQVHWRTMPFVSAKAAANESYLRIDRIVSAAEIADVDAIHPGYVSWPKTPTLRRL